MSNLQPTEVIDKNGKKTTVHKRVDAPEKNSRARKAPAPSSAVVTGAIVIRQGLSDIRKAAEPVDNVVVYGSDSSIPEGYMGATAKVLGLITSYVLKESESGDKEDAQIIGRVEVNPKTNKSEAYAGGNIKGGGWVGSGLLMEDAVQRMIDRSNS